MTVLNGMSYLPRPDCQIPTLGQIYDEHLPEAFGRFVEVGAFDGATYSNTVMLAEAGWHGLYIEPIPQHAADCRKNHKEHSGIHVVQTAVSDRIGEAELYLIGECSSLVWDQNAVDWGGKLDRKITVPTTTLDALLEKMRWEPRFEVLVVDVEQHELAVLGGFSLGKWLPKLAIIETHEKDTAAIRNFKAGPISAYFHNFQYRKVYADHINSIFVRP